MTNGSSIGNSSDDRNLSLPRIYQVEGEALVCVGCKRRWRLQSFWHDPEQNREYLIQHALLHSKVVHPKSHLWLVTRDLLRQ